MNFLDQNIVQHHIMREANTAPQPAFQLSHGDGVPADHKNGIITGYTITYKSQTENDNGNVVVNDSVRQIELTSLKEYVNYKITVFASTVKGDGPASDSCKFKHLLNKSSQSTVNRGRFWRFQEVTMRCGSFSCFPKTFSSPIKTFK